MTKDQVFMGSNPISTIYTQEIEYKVRHYSNFLDDHINSSKRYEQSEDALRTSTFAELVFNRIISFEEFMNKQMDHLDEFRSIFQYWHFHN